MVKPYVILPAESVADLKDAAALFRACAAAQPVDLGYQGFDAELAALPRKYAPPAGALLIARNRTGAAIGCVAMRPTDAGRQLPLPVPPCSRRNMAPSWGLVAACTPCPAAPSSLSRMRC